jgi:hypothetical protein
MVMAMADMSILLLAMTGLNGTEVLEPSKLRGCIRIVERIVLVSVSTLAPGEEKESEIETKAETVADVVTMRSPFDTALFTRTRSREYRRC